MLAPLGTWLSGAIDHWARGRVARGFASLAMRIVGFVIVGAVGAGIGAAVDAERGGDMNLTGTVVGAGIGTGLGNLAMVALDLALLTYTFE